MNEISKSPSMFLFQKLSLFLIFILIINGCENGDAPKQEIVKETPVENPKSIAVKKENAEFEVFKTKFDTNYIMGKFDPAKHPDFLKIPIKYADREGLYLRKDAFAKFVEMYDAAKKDKINLKIRSATRNFKNQKRIWGGKWRGSRKIENGKNAASAYPIPKSRALKILEYSSMPGTSRHHWGTDIDLNNFTNEYFESGQGLKEYNWLTENAGKFGYCQVYSNKEATNRTGYQEEKWHWSFLPIAKNLTQLAKEQMTNRVIKGFDGSETAIEIKVVENYILGINPDCL